MRSVCKAAVAGENIDVVECLEVLDIVFPLLGEGDVGGLLRFSRTRGDLGEDMSVMVHVGLPFPEQGRGTNMYKSLLIPNLVATQRGRMRQSRMPSIT